MKDHNEVKNFELMMNKNQLIDMFDPEISSNVTTLTLISSQGSIKHLSSKLSLKNCRPE
jgi:hypothetical protein